MTYYVSLNSVAPTIIVAREPKLWDLKRKLSVNECKKLQGFPDSFEFNVSDAQAKKQLGNSVAIPVVDAIVDSMIKAYESSTEMKSINLIEVNNTSLFQTDNTYQSVCS